MDAAFSFMKTSENLHNIYMKTPFSLHGCHIIEETTERG
jgi:hypothetical protein